MNLEELFLGKCNEDFLHLKVGKSFCERNKSIINGIVLYKPTSKGVCTSNSTKIKKFPREKFWRDTSFF